MKKMYRFEVDTSQSQDLNFSCLSISLAGMYVGLNSYDTNLVPSVNINEPSTVDLKDKKLYRYPKLALPRMKLDIIKEKCNVKITRDQDSADYAIISETYLQAFLETDWGNYVTFKKLIDYLKEKNYKQDIIDFFSNYPEDDDVSMNRKYWGNAPKTNSNIQAEELDQWFGKACERGNFGYVPAKMMSTYDTVVAMNNLVFDTHMVSLCNEDSLVLNKDEYRNVQSMLKSEDNQNRSLALEMISNCNLEKSFDYVALLYYFLYDYMKDTSNWNSVNVKTLRKRLDAFTPYGNSQYGNLYDNFIKKLDAEKYLTKFAFEETARYAFHNVVKRSMGLGENNVFEIDVKAIKLKDKYVLKTDDLPF